MSKDVPLSRTPSVPKICAPPPSPPHHRFLLSWTNALLLAFVVRITFAMIICTSFTPDEYYQGVEQAYRTIYGSSGKPTWEWTPEYRIRSYVMILPYIILFAIGKTLGIDSIFYVTVGPRLVQGTMTAISDVCLYSICRSLGGS